MDCLWQAGKDDREVYLLGSHSVQLYNLRSCLIARLSSGVVCTNSFTFAVSIG